MLAGDKALPPTTVGSLEAPVASVAGSAAGPAVAGSVAGSVAGPGEKRELIIYYILRLYLFFY